MAYPSEGNALPANPEDLSPETLRSFYTMMRSAILSIQTELGNDPGALLAASEHLAATTQTSAYTLALTDKNTMVEVNSASTANVTVPPNSSVAFPTGSVVVVGRFGAGAVALVAGSGVTIRSAGGLLSLRAQYSVATLRKRATNEWWAWGDLA